MPADMLGAASSQLLALHRAVSAVRMPSHMRFCVSGMADAGGSGVSTICCMAQAAAGVNSLERCKPGMLLFACPHA